MVLALLLQAEGLVVDGAVPGHVAHQVLHTNNPHTSASELTTHPSLAFDATRSDREGVLWLVCLP